MRVLGNVTCSAYPIEQLDSINSKTGELNVVSALNLIVFGVRLRCTIFVFLTYVIPSVDWVAKLTVSYFYL